MKDKWGKLPGFGQQCPFRSSPSRELQCRKLLHVSPLWNGISGLLMYPVVYFYSESRLYLMGTVIHSGQMVQRSHPDKDPNGKSQRHFGAVSDTMFSWGCSYKMNTFLDEKLKFALNNLTLLEKKEFNTIILGDQTSDCVIFHWKVV